MSEPEEPKSEPEVTPTGKKHTGGRKCVLTVETLGPAIEKYNGNVHAIARYFKVTRTAVLRVIHNTPSLQQLLDDAREGILDEVEGSLYKAAKKGEGWAVCFFLKTQGKKRGYIERDTRQLDEMQAELDEMKRADARQPEKATGGTEGKESPKESGDVDPEQPV